MNDWHGVRQTSLWKASCVFSTSSFRGNLVVFLSVNLGLFPETHLLKALARSFPIFQILKWS